MLVLTRLIEERLVLLTSDGPLVIQVTARVPGGVRLGIDAPKSVLILREEQLTAEQRERVEARRD